LSDLSSAEPEAHGSLRQALKLVRRAIEDRDQGVIVSEGDALVLKPAAVEVDVALRVAQASLSRDE